MQYQLFFAMAKVIILFCYFGHQQSNPSSQINYFQDLQRKRKAENNEQMESSKILPLKQKNLDEDSHSLVTPPQSPFTQLGETVSRACLAILF